MDTEGERSNVAQCQSGAGTSSHAFHSARQVSKVVAELQTFSVVRELVAHGVIGEGCHFGQFDAVPTLQGRESVASLGEGKHRVKACRSVAVQAGDVPVAVEKLFDNDLVCCLIIYLPIIRTKL